MAEKDGQVFLWTQSPNQTGKQGNQIADTKRVFDAASSREGFLDFITEWNQRNPGDRYQPTGEERMPEPMILQQQAAKSSPKGNGNASGNKKKTTLKDVAGHWSGLCTSVWQIVFGFVMTLYEWMLVYPCQWFTQWYKKTKLHGNNYTLTVPCKCKFVLPNTETSVESPVLLVTTIVLLVGAMINKHTWMQHVSASIATLAALWVFKPQQRTMVFLVVPLVVTLNALVLVWTSEGSLKSVVLTAFIQMVLPMSVIEALNRVTGAHRQSLISWESVCLMAALAIIFGGHYCVSFKDMPQTYDSAFQITEGFQKRVCGLTSNETEKQFADGNHTACSKWVTELQGGEGNNEGYDKFKCGKPTSGKVFPLSRTGNGVPMPMPENSVCFFIKQHEQKGITVNCAQFMERHNYTEIKGFVERQGDEETFAPTVCDHTKKGYWNLARQVCITKTADETHCRKRYCPLNKTVTAVADYIVPHVVNKSNVPVNGDELQANVKTAYLEIAQKDVKDANQTLEDITTGVTLVLLMVLLYVLVVYHTKATSVCGKVKKLFHVGDTIKSSGWMKFILLLQGFCGALASMGLRNAKLGIFPEMVMFACVGFLLTIILMCGYKLQTAETYDQTSTGNNATDDEDVNMEHLHKKLYDVLCEIDGIITNEADKDKVSHHFGCVDHGTIRYKINAYLPESTYVFGHLRSLTWNKNEYTSPEFKTWVKQSILCAEKREQISPFVRKWRVTKIAKEAMQKFLSLLVFIITGLWNFLWFVFHFVKVPAYAQSFVIEFVFMKSNPELINIIVGLFYVVFGVYINGHNVIGMILQLRTVDAANAMALVFMQFEFMNLRIISNSCLTSATETKFKGCLQSWAGKGADLTQYVEDNKGAPLLCLRESAATRMQLFQIGIVIWFGLCIIVTFVEFMVTRTPEFVAKRTAKKTATGNNSA